MKNKIGAGAGVWLVWLLVAAVLILTGLGILLSIVGRSAEGFMGLLSVLSVSTLIVLLFVVAIGFKVIGLADPQQALGLPEGSIRAMIALFLIMIFILFGLYLFRVVGNPNANTTDGGVDLAKQLVNTIGTLVVAISGFYFGSRAVQVARGVATPAAPKIRSIKPEEGEQDTTVDTVINGEGFMMTKTVRLLRDKTEIIASEVTSNSTMIKASFKIDKDTPMDTYDLIVVNDDGGEDTLAKAFKVAEKKPPAQPPNPSSNE